MHSSRMHTASKVAILEGSHQAPPQGAGTPPGAAPPDQPPPGSAPGSRHPPPPQSRSPQE